MITTQSLTYIDQNGLAYFVLMYSRLVTSYLNKLAQVL